MPHRLDIDEWREYSGRYPEVIIFERMRVHFRVYSRERVDSTDLEFLSFAGVETRSCN